MYIIFTFLFSKFIPIDFNNFTMPILNSRTKLPSVKIIQLKIELQKEKKPVIIENRQIGRYVLLCYYVATLVEIQHCDSPKNTICPNTSWLVHNTTGCYPYTQNSFYIVRCESRKFSTLEFNSGNLHHFTMVFIVLKMAPRGQT